MGTTDQVEAIVLVELFGDDGPEQPACAARANLPRVDVLGVGPHQVAERSGVWNLLNSLQHSHLIDAGYIRRQPTMNAQDAAIDDRGKAEVVEDVGAEPPRVGVAVFPYAFLVESIDLCDLPGFVIATKQRDAIRVSCFQGKQQLQRLDTMVPSINEIPHEHVTCRRDRATLSEQLQQVEILPMDIAADGHRAPHRLHVRLLHQQRLDAQAQDAQVVLGQALAPHQLLDPDVQVGLHRPGQATHATPRLDARRPN